MSTRAVALPTHRVSTATPTLRGVLVENNFFVGHTAIVVWSATRMDTGWVSPSSEDTQSRAVQPYGHTSGSEARTEQPSC